MNILIKLTLAPMWLRATLYLFIALLLIKSHSIMEPNIADCMMGHGFNNTFSLKPTLGLGTPPETLPQPGPSYEIPANPGSVGTPITQPQTRPVLIAKGSNDLIRQLEPGMCCCNIL